MDPGRPAATATFPCMNQHHSVETSAGAPLTNQVDLLESNCTGRMSQFRGRRAVGGKHDGKVQLADRPTSG
jgi:hypothetical protein